MALNTSFNGVVYDDNGIINNAYYQCFIYQGKINSQTINKYNKVLKVNTLGKYSFNLGDSSALTQNGSIDKNTQLVLCVFVLDPILNQNQNQEPSRNDFISKFACIHFDLINKDTYIQDILLKSIQPPSCNFILPLTTFFDASDKLISQASVIHQWEYKNKTHYHKREWFNEILFEKLFILNDEFIVYDNGSETTFLPNDLLSFKPPDDPFLTITNTKDVLHKVINSYGLKNECLKQIKIYNKMENCLIHQPTTYLDTDVVFNLCKNFNHRCVLSILFEIQHINTLKTDSILINKEILNSLFSETNPSSELIVFVKKFYLLGNYKINQKIYYFNNSENVYSSKDYFINILPSYPKINEIHFDKKMESMQDPNQDPNQEIHPCDYFVKINAIDPDSIIMKTETILEYKIKLFIQDSDDWLLYKTQDYSQKNIFFTKIPIPGNYKIECSVRNMFNLETKQVLIKNNLFCSSSENSDKEIEKIVYVDKIIQKLVYVPFDTNTLTEDGIFLNREFLYLTPQNLFSIYNSFNDNDKMVLKNLLSISPEIVYKEIQKIVSDDNKLNTLSKQEISQKIIKELIYVTNLDIVLNQETYNININEDKISLNINEDVIGINLLQDIIQTELNVSEISIGASS